MLPVVAKMHLLVLGVHFRIPSMPSTTSIHNILSIIVKLCPTNWLQVPDKWMGQTPWGSRPKQKSSGGTLECHMALPPGNCSCAALKLSMGIAYRLRITELWNCERPVAHQTHQAIPATLDSMDLCIRPWFAIKFKLTRMCTGSKAGLNKLEDNLGGGVYFDGCC